MTSKTTSFEHCLTVVIPNSIYDAMEYDRAREGVSKGHLVRKALMLYYSIKDLKVPFVPPVETSN